MTKVLSLGGVWKQYYFVVFINTILTLFYWFFSHLFYMFIFFLKEIILLVYTLNPFISLGKYLAFISFSAIWVQVATSHCPRQFYFNSPPQILLFPIWFLVLSLWHMRWSQNCNLALGQDQEQNIFLKKYWTLGKKKKEQKNRSRPQDEMLTKINKKAEAEQDGEL